MSTHAHARPTTSLLRRPIEGNGGWVPHHPVIGIAGQDGRSSAAENGMAGRTGDDYTCAGRTGRCGLDRPNSRESLLTKLVARALPCLAVIVLAACATQGPSGPTAWQDPSYRGPQFHKIFVVGLGPQSLADVPGFEDLMVSTLQSAGIPAVPGYRFVPSDGAPDQATMKAAITRSGADAALLVRLSDPSTQTSIGYGVGGVVSVGPDMYAGWYEPGFTSQSHQVSTIYTTLFDVKTAKQVWTYNPQTASPKTLRQDAPAFANDVVNRLLASGLVATL